MSNIAEGFAKRTNKDFAHFLDMARGSTLETQSLLYIARDLDYLEETPFRTQYQLAEETVALIAGLTSYLRNRLGR